MPPQETIRRSRFQLGTYALGDLARCRAGHPGRRPRCGRRVALRRAPAGRCSRRGAGAVTATVVLVGLTVCTYALKAAAPLALGGRPLPERGKQRLGLVYRDTELVDLHPRRNMRMGPGIDVRIDADRHAGDDTQSLRNGFDATMRDPAFLAEMDKLHLNVGPMNGDEMQKLINKLYTFSPTTIERVTRLYGSSEN